MCIGATLPVIRSDWCYYREGCRGCSPGAARHCLAPLVWRQDRLRLYIHFKLCNTGIFTFVAYPDDYTIVYFSRLRYIDIYMSVTKLGFCHPILLHREGCSKHRHWRSWVTLGAAGTCARADGSWVNTYNGFSSHLYACFAYAKLMLSCIKSHQLT